MSKGKFSKSRTSVPVAAPKETPAPQPQQEAKPKRGPRISTLIFYTVYVMLVIGIVFGLFYVINTVEQQLIDFEASQPDPKSDAVFEELFAQPDWAALYDLAGFEDTAFEGKEAYAEYMEQRIGGQPLQYLATSAGLSGDRKYIVTLGSEIIGSFTLVCDPEAAVPQWELGEIELIREQPESIRVRKLATHTVYVNGVALDESYTTHIGSTNADKYLPRGAYNVWIHTQQVTGLALTPEVTAVNELGEAVEVTYDSKTRTYITADAVTTCTDEERELAMNVLTSYVLFVMDRIPEKDLEAYFDPESQLYADILAEEPWMQTNFDPEFADPQITSFFRYSNKLFSVRICLSAYVTRINGTQKEYEITKTLVFRKTEEGWICDAMIDEDLADLDQTVRITFMDGDTVLSSEFYDTDLTKLTAPLLSSAEGLPVAYWYREEIDGNGVLRQITVFTPDSYGNVTVPEDMELEPMVLYAHFNEQ